MIITRQQDGGITLATDTRPSIIIVVVVIGTIDGDIAEQHCSSVGNGNLDVTAKRSRQHVVVACHEVTVHSGEVDGWTGHHFHQFQLIVAARLPAQQESAPTGDFAYDRPFSHALVWPDEHLHGVVFVFAEDLGHLSAVSVPHDACRSSFYTLGVASHGVVVAGVRGKQ